MNKLLPKILIFTAFVFSTGCLRTTVNMDEVDGLYEYRQRHSFFLFGLLPDERLVNASEVCPKSKIDKLESQTTFLDGFLSGITIGIYSPKTLIAWCKGA